MPALNVVPTINILLVLNYIYKVNIVSNNKLRLESGTDAISSFISGLCHRFINIQKSNETSPSLLMFLIYSQGIFQRVSYFKTAWRGIASHIARTMINTVLLCPWTGTPRTMHFTSSTHDIHFQTNDRVPWNLRISTQFVFMDPENSAVRCRVIVFAANNGRAAYWTLYSGFFFIEGSVACKGMINKK